MFYGKIWRYKLPSLGIKCKTDAKQIDFLFSNGSAKDHEAQRIILSLSLDIQLVIDYISYVYNLVYNKLKIKRKLSEPHFSWTSSFLGPLINKSTIHTQMLKYPVCQMINPMPPHSDKSLDTLTIVSAS